VEGNARLTAAAAVVLLVLLAAEGATLLSMGSLLTEHVFIGFALVPPTALKVGTTLYRFARYYAGSPTYRRKGPPPLILRVLGPVVVITTLTLLATGVALSPTRGSTRDLVLLLHKASFVVWFAAMTVHVLGHILDLVRLGPRDWRAAPPATAADHGVRSRRWLIATVVVAGCFVGVFGLIALGPWPVSSDLSR
jgi:hypothetical protein